MAVWVPQNEASSVTSAARSRVSYLSPLVPLVLDTVLKYFESTPAGEGVTPQVLKAIGRNRLIGVAGNRGLDRAKQDVGLLVAITLVDCFGAMRVQTLRRPDRRGTSARRNTEPGLEWVKTYAAHRVVPEKPTVPRILLDTSTVRRVIHGDPGALDTTGLASVKGPHPVSIADGALAELAHQLLEGQVPPKMWATRVAALDQVLDDGFPVAPGGNELAAFWGAHSPVGLDLGESQAYYRAAWGYLRRTKSARDLSRTDRFVAPSGRTYAIRLDRAHVRSVLEETGKKWAAWVATIGRMLVNLKASGEDVGEDEVRELTNIYLARDMGVADAAKLDLVVRVLAKRARQASHAKTPYSPKGKPNDPIDLDLLFGIPLPGWVVTDDARLIRLVRETKSADRNKVMAPSELMQRLTQP